MVHQVCPVPLGSQPADEQLARLEHGLPGWRASRSSHDLAAPDVASLNRFRGRKTRRVSTSWARNGAVSPSHAARHSLGVAGGYGLTHFCSANAARAASTPKRRSRPMARSRQPLRCSASSEGASRACGGPAVLIGVDRQVPGCVGES